MREILGQNLAKLFEKMQYDAELEFFNSDWEIWAISDADFEKLNAMSDTFFSKNCDGWYRYSTGSILGTPTGKVTVNGKDIIAWSKSDSNFVKTAKTEFDNLYDYSVHAIGASNEKNFCSVCVDLAKYNQLTLGELFRKYEGEYKPWITDSIHAHLYQ